MIGHDKPESEVRLWGDFAQPPSIVGVVHERQARGGRNYPRYVTGVFRDEFKVANSAGASVEPRVDLRCCTGAGGGNEAQTEWA